MKSALPIALTLVLCLVLLVGATIAASHQFGFTMGVHGWIALIIGTVLSLALSGGLFWLSFHSARSGHDARVETRPHD